MLDKKKREWGLYEREINESEEKAKTVTPKKKTSAMDFIMLFLLIKSMTGMFI